MDRRKRTIIVVAVAVLVAMGASMVVYRAIKNIPVRQVEIASKHIVVASRTLSIGTPLTKDDVKLAAWPARNPVPGSFTSIDAVVNRGLLADVNENEPITESRLAPVQAGAGLSPVIPAGMRAVSVKVNEVISVAGFVVPGSRVDVVVSVHRGDDTMSRVVVSNVQVLTANTRYDQEEAKQGKPIPSTVVTLLVTPPDAERIALATNEGRITLALRNPLDQAPTVTSGIRVANLMGQPSPEPVAKVVKGRKTMVTPKPAVPVVVVQPPKPYIVEAIRGAKRTEEKIIDPIRQQ